MLAAGVRVVFWRCGGGLLGVVGLRGAASGSLDQILSAEPQARLGRSDLTVKLNSTGDRTTTNIQIEGVLENQRKDTGFLHCAVYLEIFLFEVIRKTAIVRRVLCICYWIRTSVCELFCRKCDSFSAKFLQRLLPHQLRRIQLHISQSSLRLCR